MRRLLGLLIMISMVFNLSISSFAIVEKNHLYEKEKEYVSDFIHYFNESIEINDEVIELYNVNEKLIRSNFKLFRKNS